VQREQLVERLRLEHALAGEQLEEHESERIDVAALRHFLARELFRRHVRRRAGADVVDRADHSGQTEVGDADLPIAVDHHVRRLQIAMQHAAFVRRGQARAHLARDFDRFVLRKPSDAAQQRRQILAIHVLHRQKRPAVRVADVVGAAHVAMGDRAGDAHFVVELREARGILNEMLRKQLERDRLTELQVVGAIDLAHAAAAERCDDAKAAGEDRSRCEATPVGAGRRIAAVARPRIARQHFAGEPRQVIHEKISPPRPRSHEDTKEHEEYSARFDVRREATRAIESNRGKTNAIQIGACVCFPRFASVAHAGLRSRPAAEPALSSVSQ
jgi:hypothetical protein